MHMPAYSCMTSFALRWLVNIPFAPRGSNDGGTQRIACWAVKGDSALRQGPATRGKFSTERRLNTKRVVSLYHHSLVVV